MPIADRFAKSKFISYEPPTHQKLLIPYEQGNNVPPFDFEITGYVGEDHTVHELDERRIMRIAATEFNLEQLALEIYFSGCQKPRCPGCHNSELHDFRVGQQVDSDLTAEIITKIEDNDPLIKRVWLLGGEPLDQDPIAMTVFVTALLNNTSAEIWLWTKRELDEVPAFFLQNCAYIKCGRYEKDNLSGHIEHGVELASANQHIFQRDVDYRVGLPTEQADEQGGDKEDADQCKSTEGDDHNCPEEVG